MPQAMLLAGESVIIYLCKLFDLLDSAEGEEREREKRGRDGGMYQA